MTLRLARWLRQGWLVALAMAAMTSVSATRSDGPRLPVRDFKRFDATPGALPKTVLPIKVSAHFDVHPERDEFWGDARYALQVRRSVSSITMHARDLTVSDVTVAGRSQAPDIQVDKQAHTVTFSWAQPLRPGNHVLSLKFSGQVRQSGEGLFRTAYRARPDRKMLATDMEPIGARLLLPNFDEPSFRTVWEIAVTTDKRFTVLGNMPQVRATPVGDGSRVRTQFAPTPSMPSYLLALGIGEFDRVTDTYAGIDLNIYVQPGQREKSVRVMGWTKEILAYLHNYFDIPYTLPKLDQLAVSGKTAGAMENWGLVTYGESGLQYDPATSSADQAFWAFNTIAHELAHQWFGNLVTMAWWDDLWLNESFAQWLGFKVSQELRPAWQVEARRIYERDGAMRVDALAAAKPIVRRVERDEQAFDSFDAISYEKGNAVVHMIERDIGSVPWQRGLRTYLQRHRLGNTRADDLWKAVGAEARKPVKAFATAWTTQPGFPMLDVSSRCEGGRQWVNLKQSRFQIRPGYVPEQMWPIATRVATLGGAGREVRFASEQTRVPLGACSEHALMVDPGSHGYFRIRYDEALFGRLLPAFATLSVEDQQRLISDSWALAQAGLASPEQTLALLSGLSLQASSNVWRYAIQTYRAMFRLLQGSPHEAMVVAHARRTLGPKFNAMGWSAQAGETDADMSLRADLVSILAAAGDADVVAEAKRRFAARGSDAASMQGDVASGVLMAVGRHATKDEWQTLLAMLKDSRYTTLSWVLTNALAQPADAAVRQHAMQTMLTDEMPRGVALRVLGRMSGTAAAEREIWAFVQANQATLFAQNDLWTQRFIYPAALGSSRDVALAEEIKTAAEKDLDQAMRAETLRSVTSVQRNAWAYEAVATQLERVNQPSQPR